MSMDEYRALKELRRQRFFDYMRRLSYRIIFGPPAVPAQIQIIDAWRKSPQREKARKSVAVFVGVPFLFTVIIACLGYFFGVKTVGGHPYLGVALGGGIVTLLAVGVSGMAVRQQRARFYARYWLEHQISDSGEVEPKAKIPTALDVPLVTEAAFGDLTALRIEPLWADTVERLDRYHKLVTSQADTSYLMAQMSAGAGFLVLISAAVVAAFAQTNIASGVIGGLGALGAAIAAYIGKTFQRSYEEATNRLLAYFQQPLDLSRILAAERLLVHLSDAAKDQAVLVMIEATVPGRGTLESAVRAQSKMNSKADATQ